MLLLVGIILSRAVRVYLPIGYNLKLQMVSLLTALALKLVVMLIAFYITTLTIVGSMIGMIAVV